MRRAVLILASYAGDAMSPPDSDYKLRLIAVVEEGGRLERRQFYGSNSEPGDISPFILNPPVGSKSGQISWGSAFASDDAPDEDVNIYDKHISVNEHFTRRFVDGSEWTYRITAVLDLLSGSSL
jgi:hypothetical protein